MFKFENDELFEKVAVAGPGFINFTLSKKALYGELEEVLKQEVNYGDSDIGKNKKIQVEFISANPTGPLTVANSRGGPFGDILANVFKKAGYQSEKGYYVNDFGGQILALGHSILKDEKAVYQGEYIEEIAKKIENNDAYEAGKEAAHIILENYLKKSARHLGVAFDEWTSESEIHEGGYVEEALKVLEEKNLLYEKEGAIWFKAKELGDERDRVLVKSDGKKTYLAGDIGFHLYKFKKLGFDKVINVWGADHHGDVPGLLAGVAAIGYKDKLEILLHQFVTILEEGEKKRMSKRKGVYVTLDELLEKAGKDAVRFFFLEHSIDTHMNFDIELAKEASNKNPVYYVQYAHARICNIFERASNDFQFQNPAFQELKQVPEMNLIKQLVKFPEVIEDTANDYQVQRLPTYAKDVASGFHKFYESCQVLTDDESLTNARLALVKATKIILKNTLDLMGISAPKKM